MSVNKVILVGRLGQNPEVRHTPAGMSVTNFSIATDESFVDKAGVKQEKTEWHKIVVWGKLADLCGKYLAKGRQCYIEGSLQTRKFIDKKDGLERQSTEVNVHVIQFLDAPKAQDVTTPPQKQDALGKAIASIENAVPRGKPMPVSEDDFPF